MWHQKEGRQVFNIIRPEACVIARDDFANGIRRALHVLM